jgi:hypothetical protein
VGFLGLVPIARAISSQERMLSRALVTISGRNRSACSMRLAIRVIAMISSPSQVPRRRASSASASSIRS